ncbi:MAG TPA: arylsulfatase [Thermoguttaceae bacterium]|nr:arylsulfatase [Thermoguttaceae bacterium]
MFRQLFSRRFALQAVALTVALAALGAVPFAQAAPAERPNVILVITDDQGYGDVAVHGNTMIQTPNLDKLYAESVRLTDFHVDPTCSPTRSALMSGRYSTRTGVWHTIMGRSLMSPAEVTLAEVFAAGGYRTGMFGKWHLGDNFPCRPQDQGFDEAFYHGGGGVGQGPDYWGNDYFDDTYFRNGKPEKATGYCTDVWFADALRFIEKNQDRPFFVYLSTNAPHGPYLVAEEYWKPYAEKGVPDAMAHFYGMITNIDENMGELVSKLDAWGLEENTVLVFMTDNGTAAGAGRGRKEPGTWNGFNAGMRGAKGSEYDGGHRVPLFIRWPRGGIGGGRDVDQLTAHVDVLPTLADLCGLTRPDGPPPDGKSLAPLLKGDASGWPERTLFVHSQRIPYPEKWRKCSVMTERWRLVGGKELYDIEADPGQKRDVAAEQPEVVGKLTAAYEGWWQSLSDVFDEFVYIGIGSEAEPVTRLVSHDWHPPDQRLSPWNQGQVRSGMIGNGYWSIEVMQPGRYEFELRRWPDHVDESIEATAARLKIADVEVSQPVPPGATKSTFTVPLQPGKTRLQTWLTLPDGRERGAYFVYIRRVE